MRNRLGVVALLFLGACGGDNNGGDITNPPDGQAVTLTVSGQGTGSGHVATSSGITPAIDCNIANSQSSGTCSGDYDEASVVSVTVTLDEGSSFDGWAGDASSCSTSLTCSIAMTANKTAVAQLSATSTQTVQITSSNYYLDPTFLGDEGAVIWVVEVLNPTSQVVQSAEVQFTSHDASGTVLASDFTFVGPIPPGETRAGQSFADLLGSEANVDIQMGEVQFGNEDLNLGAARIVSSNWRVDPDFAGEGAVIWNVEVENTATVQLEAVEVQFTTYDSSGRIVAEDETFVGPIPPGERRSSESFADYHANEANVKFQIASVR
jgi:hypothetical protein